MDTPEETAESVGRILCAEHAQRMEAISAQLDAAQAIQSAKEKVLAGGPVEQANERLESFAAFFEANREKLLACRVVLTDLDRVDPESKVHLSMQIEINDWVLDDDGDLLLKSLEMPVLLTLTELDGEWRVTRTSHDFSLPGGALHSLLD